MRKSNLGLYLWKCLPHCSSWAQLVGAAFPSLVLSTPDGKAAVCTALRRCPILRLAVNRGSGHLRGSAEMQKGWEHPVGERSRYLAM